MKYKDLSWRLLAGRCTVAMILAVLLLAGCGPGKRSVSPEVRSKLNEETEIIAFRYSNFVILGKPHKPFEYIADTYAIVKVREDPLIPLMENFLSAIKADLKLNNIRTLPESRHHHEKYRWHLDRGPERTYDLIEIQRTFQSGLVFDFDMRHRVFEFDRNVLVDFRTWQIQETYVIIFSAKARLIRAKDQEILWQGVCEITDRGLTMEDFPEISDPSAQIKAGALAQEKLDSAINACSKELVKQFMGK
jgi:hypothetical protein